MKRELDKIKDIENYFLKLDEEVRKVYGVAAKAKSRGYDPEDKIDILLTRNMAERVVGLISVIAPQIKETNIVESISGLEKEYGKSDWRVAFKIGLEVSQEKFCKFKNKKEAMEVGIRISLAYLTVGIVSSPLEGFTELKIKKRRDGKEYFCLMFSGPIRSAGTTATCAGIAVADYIRKNMGYDKYDPSENEIKRMSTEVRDFHERITNLQYFPSEEEIEYMVKNLPVQIDGEPSETLEVSNYKDLDRIETNRIRNGICLVLGESLTQKAAKFWGKLSKFKDEFGITEWDFLEKFIELQKKIKAGKKENIKKGIEEKISPDYTYIKDLVAGRPILTHPLRIGGFRLRYGRCRISGLSSMAMHPATMVVLDSYIGIGTQLRYERPGKSSAMSICDSIEGPIVKLRNGEVLFLDDVETAKKYRDKIEEILFLGDFLVNYAEFFNRGHKLIPCGYCEEWWLQEIKKKDKNFKIDNINLLSFDEAYRISEKYKVPLHPRYTYHWSDISKREFLNLVNAVGNAEISKERIIISDLSVKRTLELLGIPHKLIENKILVEKDWAKGLSYSLGILKSKKNIKLADKENVLDCINEISLLEIRDKSGTFIGARMGRPEKSKMRKLTGSPHVLFPVGEEGGKMRALQSTLDKGKISGEFPLYYCENCGRETIYSLCEECDVKTKKMFYCSFCDKLVEKCKHGGLTSFKRMEIDIKHFYNSALRKLNIDGGPSLIKGVRGTSNKEHIPENLVKGVLRAVHELYVNKDGTIRYDMTEMPITSFRAKEIGTNVNKLRELGYGYDIYGNFLENEDQLVELKPQDVILPCCSDSDDEGADNILFRVTQFIDDLLTRFYNVGSYYNLKDKNDLVGHLVLGLAPHTSAAIVGRIIGFSKTQCCFAHPLWHSACRRDCEGDELCVMLLLDALINFSRQYLPAHRGGTQDAPLVSSSTLIASEVDEMMFDMDVVREYPLEFYEAAMNYKEPWDFEMEQVRHRLGTGKEYFDLGFTHDTKDINEGVLCSVYKRLPTMEEKVLGQIKLAELIRAVDAADVARLLIDRHFMRDIKGNLRKFSMQQFRCVNCNEKYRRPPLSGICLRCKGKIVFTVAEGSIVKYLQPCLSLVKKFNLPNYLKQSLELTKLRIESVFGKDSEKQEGLGKWFGKR
jgi:DNA polymerase II large subunit